MSRADEGPPTLPRGVASERTGTGLEYFEIELGHGTPAGPGSRVRVRLRAWLTDGTLVDRTEDEGDPFEFELGAGEVIRALDEGLAGMREGGRRRLIVPSDLAYGPRGNPPRVPPFATLIYDVELTGLA